MKYSLMCGSFRSGTSICSILLGKHSELMYTNELWTYRNPEVINNCIRRLNIRFPNLVGSPFITMEMLGENYQAFLDEWKISPITGTKDIINRLLKYTPKSGVKVYGDKLPEYVFDLHALKDTIPNLKVLMCVRDGRDVIQSQVSRYHYYLEKDGTIGQNWWRRPTVKDCISDCKNWLEYISEWDRIKDKLDYYEINYSRLISHTDVVAREIAMFLEVDQEEMSNIFKEEIVSGKDQIWKKDYPDINKQLPNSWKTMLKKYGFEI